MNIIANPGTEAQSRKFYFTPEAAKRIESKEDTTILAICQVGGHANCNKSIHAQHRHTLQATSLKCHPALNVKIRALKVTSGADKKTPNFMILLHQSVHAMEKQQTSIMQSLNRAITRGDKLLIGRTKENHDMCSRSSFLEDLPANVGEFCIFP
jgi:hypothetical protein